MKIEVAATGSLIKLPGVGAKQNLALVNVEQMSRIDRPLTLDVRHIAKHLPDTPQMQKLLQREGSVHVSNDQSTLERVAEAIIQNGELTGTIRGHDRYGLYFDEAIGYRLDADGNRTPLYYGEIKVKGDKYHVIPRTRPSR